MRLARALSHFTLCAIGLFACASDDAGTLGGENGSTTGGGNANNASPGQGPGATSSGATTSSPPGPSGGRGAPDAGADGAGADGAGADSGGSPSGTGLFTQPVPWTKRIDGLTKSSDSGAIISALAASGGWGTGKFKMDMSIEVLHADSSTPFMTFTPTTDFYSPDCDHVPFPVPPGGALEGETGYQCTTDGDCHLLVVHGPTNKLYEMWRANIIGSDFQGGCVAVWDLTKLYPDNLRGDGCTSADAGGFPLTAMLATADEVAAGNIAHALRFILPNSRIRRHAYVHPGTHTTGPTSGGADAPPYGVRLRLRVDYDLSSLPSDGARVIAKALQQYGMFLADGGQVPLTVRSDRSTKHKWTDVGVDELSLAAITANDMEVVDMGTVISGGPDCSRNP